MMRLLARADRGSTWGAGDPLRWLGHANLGDFLVDYGVDFDWMVDYSGNMLVTPTSLGGSYGLLGTKVVTDQIGDYLKDEDLDSIVESLT